ncbi:MAG TPA: glycosyltransferase family 2 protein, partial [Usitatibacteraceae bacterium]|nr:glycosyltransferase family 2 protein [Usitatibacteraceae bacterium]
ARATLDYNAGHMIAPNRDVPTDKIPLSVVIISKNAASQIAGCIDSVAFADEVLVVDSGSEDETRAIAEVRGCRVLEKDWLGFGQQKQFAVTQARHDWVLCLDVDERVTAELAASIGRTLKNPATFAYRMARRNRFLGRWLAHGEGYPDWSLRLFHRAHASWSNDPVHEAVITTVSVDDLAGDLLHDSAEEITTYLQKQNRYSSLHAEALYGQGVRAGYLKLFLSPLARFIKFYVIRLGFLDGGPGFAHVAVGCFAAFAKYAKLIELAQKAQQDGKA